MSERWMVVKKAWKIPGGYRVVQAGLTREQAIARIASYRTPHQAITQRELYAARIAALSVAA